MYALLILTILFISTMTFKIAHRNIILMEELEMRNRKINALESDLKSERIK